MMRARLAVAAIVALIAALAVAGLAGRARDGSAGRAPAAPLALSAAIEPRAALFGDELTATVAVVVDRRKVDPATVQVDASFRPYTATRTVESRVRTGDAERVTVAYRLACLDDVCLPRPAGFSFTPLRASATTRGGTSIRAEAKWPVVLVGSRVTEEQRSAASFRAGASELVPPDWAVEPGLAAALLTAAAALFALLAVGVAAYVLLALWPRPRLEPRETVLSPVEQALAATRRAARAGGPRERRRALDLLSRALRRADAPELARAATRLAWSSERPAPPRVESFADDVASARKRGT